EDRAGRIYLDDFAARLETRHVEIVDHHVQEDSARYGHVGRRGGSGVAGGDLDELRRPDGARLHEIADLAEIVVETAVESDLKQDARLLDGVEGGMDLRDGQVDGLLAEDVLAGLGRLHYQIRMGIGRRANQDRLNVFVGEKIARIPIYVGDSEVLRPSLDGRRHVDVRNRDEPGLRHEIRDILRMDLSDPSRADYS